MPDTVVTADHVWKQYRLGPMKTLWSSLGRRRAAADAHDEHGRFWALRDVSLRVKQGETVGLLGHNGSGKSTLLKTLCGVTRPTRGAVSVHGRVVPLIEVGAGFHQELSGRENIYLNAAILGLSRSETRKRFDDIVAFAELERFLDTPVKRYSSGMFMRLAFAVAAQIDPEVLLIDEVLAVGDLGFQMKCMDRIKHLKDQGVTIVFVSHSLDHVGKVCERAVLLSHGSLIADGPAQAIISKFQTEMHSLRAELTHTGSEAGAEGRGTGADIEVLEVITLDADGHVRSVFGMDEPMRVRVRYLAHRPIVRPVFGVAFMRGDGLFCAGPNTELDCFDTGAAEGEGWFELWVESLPLTPHTYTVNVGLFESAGVVPYDMVENACTFTVESPRVQHGAFSLRHSWRHCAGVAPAPASSAVSASSDLSDMSDSSDTGAAVPAITAAAPRAGAAPAQRAPRQSAASVTGKL